MGDVILTTPLLTALAELHGPVDVVATPAVGRRCSIPTPPCGEVIRYDKRGADRGWPGLRRVAVAAAPTRATPPPTCRIARGAPPRMVLLARIPERIGFEDSPAAPLYTRRLPRPRAGARDRAALVAGRAAARRAGTAGDARPHRRRTRPRRSGGSRAAAISGDFIGAGRRQSLGCQALAVLPGARGAAGADPWSRSAGRPMPRSGTRSRRRHRAGRTAPADRSARARRPRSSRARRRLVTNDSSPLHLALATRTPMVALFGPTVPSFGFGPLDPDAICLGEEELLCRPCATYGPAACPLDHHRCLRQLGVERVVEALATVRQRAGAGADAGRHHCRLRCGPGIPQPHRAREPQPATAHRARGGRSGASVSTLYAPSAAPAPNSRRGSRACRLARRSACRPPRCGPRRCAQYWRTFRRGVRRDATGRHLYHGLSHEIPRDLPRTGIPGVVTFHDLLFERHPELFPVIDRMSYGWRYRWSAEHAPRSWR